MNVVDIVVVLLVLVLGLRGLRRGFVRELFSFAGWFGGAVAAVLLLFELAPLLAESLELPAAIAGLIAFVGVFVLVSTAIWLLGWLVSSFIRLTLVLRPVDRLLGFALGLLEGLTFAGVLAVVFGASPLFPAVREQVESSLLGSRLAEHTGAFFSAVRSQASDVRGREPSEDAAPDTDSGGEPES